MTDTIVSIHQPSYFPWLGLLHKIARSDQYVLMDEVQLADRAYQHRNIFLSKEGQTKLLTLSIAKKGYRDKTIREIELASNEWQTTHLNFLRENYRKLPHFEEVFAVVRPLYERPYRMLIEVLYDSVKLALELFNIPVKLTRQSELTYDHDAQKSDLILELVKATGCRTYLSGTGAREYMNLDDFHRNGINVEFDHFEHPTYRQHLLPAGEFQPGFNCLDVLFNAGIAESREILRRSLTPASAPGPA